MTEPNDLEVKDDEGWTWIHTEHGWSLKNHEQLCYIDQEWQQVEQEYGPMHLIGV